MDRQIHLTLVTCPFFAKGFSVFEVSMSNTRITDEWGSFAAIPHEFIDRAGGLSDQARWLFVLLRRYTNGQTGKAFPSYKVIQDRTGWTPKTIAKAVRELEEAGWLIREKALGDVTQYILTRRQHFPQGSEVLPVGKQGTSQREVGVLPVGKSNKIEVNRPTKQTEGKRGGEIAVISQQAIIVTPPPPASADAGSIAREYFPQMGIWQQELIDNAQINHLTIWRKCCEDWRDNRYSERNIKGLIDSYYKAETQHAKEKTNGRNSNAPRRESHNERAARETFELIDRLTGQDGRDRDTDPANAILKLPAAFGGR